MSQSLTTGGYDHRLLSTSNKDDLTVDLLTRRFAMVGGGNGPSAFQPGASTERAPERLTDAERRMAAHLVRSDVPADRVTLTGTPPPGGFEGYGLLQQVLGSSRGNRKARRAQRAAKRS